MAIGKIRSDGNGKMTLELDPCPLCDKVHRTPLIRLEQKVEFSGKQFLYWTRCVDSSNIILIRSASGDTIRIAFAHDTAVQPKP